MNPVISIARRSLAVFGIAAAALLTWPARAAYPDKPITIIVPFASGGTTDLAARLLAELLHQSTGAIFLIDNKPGAGGMLGVQHVSKAAADGYTLLFGSDSLVLQPLVRPSFTARIDDFIALVRVRTSANYLAVSAAVPARNAGELVALAKANPGKVDYATGGTGTTLHMAGEMFARAAGIKVTHVPYKGATPSVTDAAGGHVQMVWAGAVDLAPFVKTGQLRMIGMSGTKRSLVMPDVPTFTELGYPDVVLVNWNAVFAPKGTPGEVVDWLTEKIAAVATSPQWFARGQALAIEPGAMLKGKDFEAFLKAAYLQNKKIVDATSIKLTD